MRNFLKNVVEMKTIIWKGILYHSLEYFKLISRENGSEATSTIIGIYQDKLYKVDYRVQINDEWEVFQFEVDYEVNEVLRKISGERTDSEWKVNGSVDAAYNGFRFIDISLTPFTNTLPIRNSKLHLGQERVIDVLYIDILGGEILPLKQRYRKDGDGMYNFQNVPNDFEATISVDEFGLVIYYPLLFERQ